MEDFASAGASLTARASEETTNFSRVVCMLFDLGPRAMELVMEAHLPGESTESLLRLVMKPFVINRKVTILVRPASQALVGCLRLVQCSRVHSVTVHSTARVHFR